MIQSQFQDKTLGLLGFGAMRFPLTADGKIDEPQVFDMIRYAHEHGVNYYDTGYSYLGGESERVLGRALKQFPRDSYYIATKFPGHQTASSYPAKEIFEHQLEKCGVEYFDFYLLHNVYENSIGVYFDPQWGIVDYLLEQKKNGRIHHLGFSAHGDLDNMRQFLERYGDVMEFCQIQLNYLDWTLQKAKEKCELLAEYHIPIWVMEPVRGGKLANLPQDAASKLRALRPDESIAAWAFRWLQGLDQVQMILSGMSTMEQVKDNIQTFQTRRVLSEQENALILELAESMKNSIPCTACRYCCDTCPQGLDIPTILHLYNEIRFDAQVNAIMRVEALGEKHPSACIGCGQCAKLCPQHIDIPQAMQDLTARLTALPSWAAMCREREHEQSREKA